MQEGALIKYARRRRKRATLINVLNHKHRTNVGSQRDQKVLRTSGSCVETCPLLVWAFTGPVQFQQRPLCPLLVPGRQGGTRAAWSGLLQLHEAFSSLPTSARTRQEKSIKLLSSHSSESVFGLVPSRPWEQRVVHASLCSPCARLEDSDRLTRPRSKVIFHILVCYWGSCRNRDTREVPIKKCRALKSKIW